jgi:hypothetical protein
MTMTTTAVAMGGMMLKDYETGTLSRVAATALAPSNVSSALPLVKTSLKQLYEKNTSLKK